MSKIEGLDTDTSIMNNLPLGYYYYYIPCDNLDCGKFLANPNDESIGTDWSSWYTNGGLAGLVARRQSEYNIYANGVYEYRPIAQVNQNGIITGIAVSDNNGNGYIPSNCKGSV